MKSFFFLTVLSLIFCEYVIGYLLAKYLFVPYKKEEIKSEINVTIMRINSICFSCKIIQYIFLNY